MESIAGRTPVTVGRVVVVVRARTRVGGGRNINKKTRGRRVRVEPKTHVCKAERSSPSSFFLDGDFDWKPPQGLVVNFSKSFLNQLYVAMVREYT